jgi:hypothetical protein
MGLVFSVRSSIAAVLAALAVTAAHSHADLKSACSAKT